MVDGDDAGSWCRHALSNHALVADVLLSFRDPRILLIPWQHRLDPDWTTAAAGSLPSFEPSDTKTADSEKDDERPSSSLPPPLPAVEFPDWGRRIRRSWTVKASRIREATAGKSRRRRRPSPLSALDGCSSASTSWTSRDGEEGSSSPENAAKMPRSFDDAAPGGGLPSKVSSAPHLSVSFSPYLLMTILPFIMTLINSDPLILTIFSLFFMYSFSCFPMKIEMFVRLNYVQVSFQSKKSVHTAKSVSTILAKSPLLLYHSPGIIVHKGVLMPALIFIPPR